MAGEGPTISWGQLKQKTARTNDGKDLREMKEVAQNYLLLGKGVVNKDKSWIPRYVADPVKRQAALALGEQRRYCKGLFLHNPPGKSSTRASLRLSGQRPMAKADAPAGL